MAVAVILPQQGNSVESCTIVEWRKGVGERVQVGEVLCVVETDKAVFEIEAVADGELLERFFEVGADVPVLTTLAVIGESGERVETTPAESVVQSVSSVKASTPPVAVAPTARTSHPDESRLFISPRAKGAAQQLGVSPQDIVGSGPGGRIIERDIVAAAPSARVKPAAGVEPSAAANLTELPMTELRKAAGHMMNSPHGPAQMTLHASADATVLTAFRQKLKTSHQRFGLTNITINDLMLYLVSRVLPQHPTLNPTLQGDRILLHHDVHLAFAVDTPRGLVLPVIRRAQQLSLKSLSQEAKRLIAACLDGSITVDELSGGTFTVTNLGSFGIEHFTPALNPPQSVTLGVGSIKLAPIEVDGQICFQKQIGLSLTIDHQLIAAGARFLQDLCRTAADVEFMLLF